jgi:hypothetical protein
MDARMRMLVFCILLFLAPAGCLLVTDRFVSTIADDFLQDSRWQINRFDRSVEMYPPRAATLRNAAPIRTLKRLGNGNSVAAVVCGSPGGPYARLFDRLAIRCGEWSVLRRARYAALIGVLTAVGTFALVLIARIGVRRYENRKQWAGPWTTLFVSRGIHIVLAIQAATALAGFAILLQTLLRHPVYAYAVLFPWMGLVWVEGRTAARFIQAEKLVVLRPTRRARAMRARA